MYQSKWTPGTDVTRHSGSAIPNNLDFFRAPVPEIGKVISADSTLIVSKQPMSTQKRLGLCLLIGSAPAVAIGFFTGTLFPPNALIIIIATIGVLIAVTSTNSSHFCSYVGEQGIVMYELKGARSTTPKTKLLIFRDASNLYTNQTRHYRNGAYTGTTYSYAWTTISNKNYSLDGIYHSLQGSPADGDLWHFANAAEGRWSGYLLQALSAQLERFGYVEFPMQGNPRMVRISDGFMEFVEKDGNSQRVAVADMKDISLASGVFQFKHKDARWWSGKGKYSFTYANIPNARLFLVYLERLAGIRLG
jgi:hypothetical protein